MDPRIGPPRAAGQNGVDTGRLEAMIEAIQAVPALGKFTFRATNHWVNGALSRSTLGGYRGASAENHREAFVIEGGLPVLMLGSDEAPNPVDYLLHAVAACLTTTLVYGAAREGVRIRALESHVESELDVRGLLGSAGPAPGGFERLDIRLRVRADCPSQKLDDLVAAARVRSPMAGFIARAVPVSVTCEAF